jgi:phosphatidate cytidylyltransferase
MGAVVLASLLIQKQVFVALAVVAVGASVWELARALGTRHLRLPVVPLVVGSAAVLVSAYAKGLEALLVAVCLTVLAAVAWRLLDVPDVVPAGDAERLANPATAVLRDVTAAVLAVAWLPLLAGFAVLLVTQPDGAERTVVFVLGAVLNDVGGYTAGVLWGRHPMAPTVSPKKSWEGLAGSALACLAGSVLSVVLLLDLPWSRWWVGALVGLAAVVTSTLGDLSESILKRDLGIKDMGSLLPGHGGVLDRLDSLLATAPVTWLLLTLLVPLS